MKKIFAGFIALMAADAAKAQSVNYNDPNVEVRTVAAFTGISVSRGIEVVLTQGKAEAVAVSASSAEYRDRIKTEVVGGVLKIYFKEGIGNLFSQKKKKAMPKAYVSAVTLKSISVSSGASLNVEGIVKGDNMELDFSSGSLFRGEINAKEVKIGQGSGADAKLSGTAQSLTIKVSSGGSFHGYNFAVNTCNAKVSSGGTIEVTVNSDLDAKANSGGSVRYKGSCSVTKSTGSGGSVVNKS